MHLIALIYKVKSFRDFRRENVFSFVFFISSGKENIHLPVSKDNFWFRITNLDGAEGCKQ